MMVSILETGAANVASLEAALRRLGVSFRRVCRTEEVVDAPALIVPGVGAFGSVMTRLSTPMKQALCDRVREDRPTLGICLGMQIFGGRSEESPGYTGLGIFSEPMQRYPNSVTTPQMGWNRVRGICPQNWVPPGAYYFANSYCLRSCPAGWTALWADWAGPFVAALSRGRVLLCQFHPELSGPLGLSVLARWCGGAVQEGASVVRHPTRIIPCMDVRAGRVVKGVRFKGLRDAGDPRECAARYAAQGADELVMLDVSATPTGRKTACRVVQTIRDEVALPLIVGGGVRAPSDAARLLEAGADKVALNTAAVEDPSRIRALAQQFGTQCVVVSIDAQRWGDGWRVVTRSGTQQMMLNAVTWARQAVDLGAGEVLLTSVDRDGTRRGYDCALVRAVSDVVSVPVIASGGAATSAHCLAAIRAGATGLLAASIFHEADLTVGELKQSLQQQGAWT